MRVSLRVSAACVAAICGPLSSLKIPRGFDWIYAIAFLANLCDVAVGGLERDEDYFTSK